jgi:hypothetical protein
MIGYIILCYGAALLLMGVILSVRGHMEPVDWAVVLLAPVTLPAFLIHYLVRQLKNKQ